MFNSSFKKINIFGIDVTQTNMFATANFLKDYDFSKKGYICFPDSYVLVNASRDYKLKEILNNALMVMPDGKPIELYAKYKGHKNISTVSGYWLCKNLLESNLSHFFYGGDNNKITLLKNYIKKQYPNANIKGFCPVPYLSESEISSSSVIENNIRFINSLKPDLIWIGISSPKQDFLMNTYINYIDKGLMLGIGGVFDYLAETKKISPEWIKKLGLRWFYRLIKEPKRLWRKYLFAITGFIYLFIKEIFSHSLNFIKTRN